MITYQIDPAHSSIEFSVRHMMISKVRGSFDKFDGAIDLDEEQPQRHNRGGAYRRGQH